MELKYRFLTTKLVILESSNRTFMELKFAMTLSLLSLMMRSNRTFMELKYQSAKVGKDTAFMF